MNKFMKRPIRMGVALLLTVALFTGCQGNSNDTANNPAPEETDEPSDWVTPVKEAYQDETVKDLYQDVFLVGAAINGNSLKTMALKHDGMKEILKKHFNSTTLSNLMKPEYLLDQKASKNSKDGMPVCTFKTCDPALKFCKENNIKMRGHTLIWHNQTPKWFFCENFDEKSGKFADKETMEKRMESYIKQVMTHCKEEYPGVVYAWDVVNECVSIDGGSYIETKQGWKLRGTTKKDNDFSHDKAVANLWYTTMGEEYVEKAFTFARKYAEEGSKLFYNDYNPFQPEKMENICKMVEKLKEKDIIDGIGLQPTVLLSYPNLDMDGEGSFKTCLETYAKLGLEIQITELSFKIEDGWIEEGSLKAQAARYREFMGLLLKEDSDNGGPCNITSVTVFGICDDYPLYEDFKQNLYLWDKDCNPKPAFYGFIEPGLARVRAKQ